jgi:hypothetical protein
VASREQQIAEYAAKLNAMWGTANLTGQSQNEGQAYTSYMDSHPDANPAVIYAEINARLELLGFVPQTIGQAAQSEAGTLGGIEAETGPAVAAGVKAAENPVSDVGQELDKGLPQWLGDFLGANGILRVVEGVLGVVLIAVGIDKLASGNAGVATKIAKVVK